MLPARFPRLRATPVWVVAILACLSLPVNAQAPPAFEVAEAHFAEGRFAAAAARYRDALTEQPAHGMSWFRLGMALHELEEWVDAALAYENAIGFQVQATSARWRRARVLARSGDTDAAFGALEELARAGFGSVVNLTDEADFASLRGLDRWTEVLGVVRANSEPCLHQPEVRRFDFWIGEWDVFSPAGAMLGSNRVESVQRGCALVEHWTNSAGRTGTSLNVYDASSGDPRWRQLYVGDFGGVTDYSRSTWEDRVLHFEATVLDARGDTVTRHMRFRPIGVDTVHQVIEDESRLGVLTPQFNGIYVRKPGS